LKFMMFMAGTGRAKVDRSSLGLLCMALVLGACGGELPRRYYYGGPGDDGGMCVGQGRHSCGCVDEPYVLVVSLAFPNTTPSAGLSDLDIDFFREAGLSATPSATAPAKGTPGADAYFVASLLDEAGGALATVIFKDPRLADAGYPSYARARFTMTLPAGVSSLHIENWDTRQVVIDLDLRGHLQLLCIDRPCLSVCQASGVDAAASPAVDASAADTPGAASGEAAEVGSATSLDAGAPDAERD
jgi:hypothetical protein